MQHSHTEPSCAGGEGVGAPRGDSAHYASCYCEENIYLLALRKLQEQSELLPADRPELFVVFVSSQSQQTPIWCQAANVRTPEAPVVWDYHVVLLQRDPAGERLILDYDTTLPFPSAADAYIQLCFRPTLLLRPEHQQ